MASPADSAPKAPGAFANARLSLEDAERLAATFRPSWELDDAPFTGAGSLSPAEVQALGGGGTHADVRAVAHANGTHGPAAAAPAGQEVENSVVIDRTITAQDLAQQQGAALKPGTTMLGMVSPLQQATMPATPQNSQNTLGATPFVAPAVPQQTMPMAQPMAPRTPISQRPIAPSFTVGPPTPSRAKPPPSMNLDEGYPKKSKMGLFVGIAAVAALVVGGIVFAVASSGSSEKVAPVPTVNKPLEDKLSSVPPPPPETAAQAQPPAPATTTAAPPPPPATTTAAVATTPIPFTPVTALPQAAAPAPTHVAAVAPKQNWAPAPGAAAARPAPKKNGPTIVRDVPF